jgi:hypothetical protein
MKEVSGMVTGVLAILVMVAAFGIVVADYKSQLR